MALLDQNATIASLTSERDELIAQNDNLTLIADGVNHDGRCVRNAVTGCVEGFVCLRCRLEDALAEREAVCEWTQGDWGFLNTTCGRHAIGQEINGRPCWCGRKVVVKA